MKEFHIHQLQSVLPSVEIQLQLVRLSLWLGGLIGSQGFADDVDSTFQFGGYIVGENYSKNIPVGFYQYGTLFVFGGSFLTQIYVPYLQHAPVKEIGVRSRWNNIWSEWYHIKCP